MHLLSLLLDAYSAIVLVSVVLSWLRLPPENPLVSFIATVTEPVLAPIRRLLPLGGGIDISPMVLLLALGLVRRLLNI